jgi:metal-responsive CopG/Arc/MetJ family transcriptional regulator
MQQKTARKQQKFISIAAPQVILDQLEQLAKASGEGRSALIKRLISEAYSRLKK